MISIAVTLTRFLAPCHGEHYLNQEYHTEKSFGQHFSANDDGHNSCNSLQSYNNSVSFRSIAAGNENLMQLLP